MKVHLVTLLLVSTITLFLGAIRYRDFVPLFPFMAHTDHADTAEMSTSSSVETIFLSLDRTTLPVPVSRSGAGGALASKGRQLIVMTHEGNFFDVTGDAAQQLGIQAPENGWDAMLAFEESNPDYSFAHFFFRYNDVEFHDDRLFVSFTQWVHPDNCYRTAIATVSVAPSDVLVDLNVSKDDWETLYVTSPCLLPNQVGRAISGHMAGGRFTIGDDNILYLASGDYAVDGTYAAEALPQDPTNSYGKVIAVDISTGQAETLSQGHSNMQGIILDNDENLFTVEHGRRGGDELNLIVAGRDYGWPQVSLGTRYNRLPLQGSRDYGRHTGFEPPVYSWLPSVAISSITTINDFHSAWDGDLLAGSLIAQTLFRIRIEDGRVLFDERIPIGFRIRDVLQHGDEIVLWTDEAQIVRLSVGEFDMSVQFAYNKIKQLGLTSLQEERVELALDQCVECHTLGVVDAANAPALGRVFQSEIASSGFDYTEALASMEGTWTPTALADYLSDPQAFAPGTSMPNPQINDPEVIDALINILASLRLQPE